MSLFFILMFLLVLVCILGLILCQTMIVRNDKVYKYRKELLAKMGSAMIADVKADRPWRWRVEVFDSVSYNEMVNQCWKPLDSFYPDKSFLE